MAEPVRHRQTKGAATDMFDLPPPRHISTLRTTEARDTSRGIPQGSPISPLLANIYMRRFVLGWKKLGLEQRLGSRLVIYADDRVPRTH
jgi:hypothetical protein